MHCMMSVDTMPQPSATMVLVICHKGASLVPISRWTIHSRWSMDQRKREYEEMSINHSLQRSFPCIHCPRSGLGLGYLTICLATLPPPPKYSDDTKEVYRLREQSND